MDAHVLIQHQPHRAGMDLWRGLVACLLAHGSTFSRVGASGKPGAVQPPSIHAFLAPELERPLMDGSRTAWELRVSPICLPNGPASARCLASQCCNRSI